MTANGVIVRLVRLAVGALAGRRMTLPSELLERYPELADAR